MTRDPLPALIVSLCLCAFAASARGQVIDFRDLAPEEGPDPVVLPSPEEVIERHLAVTGGRAAYERIQNRRIKGTLRQSNNDGTSSLTIHESAPGHRRVRVASTGGRTVEYVTNPDESWTYDGDIVVASGGDQRTQEIRRAAFNMLLDFRRHYPLARTIGVELVAGRPAYKVRLIAEDCQKAFLFFDQETGRHVRTVQEIAYAGDTIPADAMMSGFEWFDGIEVPTKTRRVLQYRGNRFVQEYAFTSFEHNVEIDDLLFATPPELRIEPSVDES